MGYLARNAHKRVDPQQVLAGAKSIITLAASYSLIRRPGRRRNEARSRGRGVVARYARYADYHDVLGWAAKAVDGPP